MPPPTALAPATERVISARALLAKLLQGSEEGVNGTHAGNGTQLPRTAKPR